MSAEKVFYLLSPDRRITTEEFSDLGRIFKDFSTYLYAFQLRIKDMALLTEEVARLKPLCNTYGVPLIVNDFVTLALDLNVDGIHIGEEDCSFETCRAIVPKEKIVGVSCYDNVDRAKAYEIANYVSFGCFFESATKRNPRARATLSTLDKWKNTASQTLCVCIGGINDKNFMPLICGGADMVAFSGYLWGGKSPYKRFALLVEILTRHTGRNAYESVVDIS